MIATKSLAAVLMVASLLAPATVASAAVTTAPRYGAALDAPAQSLRATPPVQVAGGGGHTCALTADGAMYCWGWNMFGQLGDDSTSLTRSVPALVSGLSSGVRSSAAGERHSCALTDSGQVKCWGWNLYGQIGDGTSTSRSLPVDVVSLGNGVRSVAAGAHHTCALTNAGGVKCWGRNNLGQLGDGTTTDRTAPVAVSGLSSGVRAIDAGYAFTCALTHAGQVLCWGSNFAGQLGDGTTIDRTEPVAVIGLGNDTSAIAAGGGHTCVRTAGGQALCWGYNGSGQLGDGTTINRLSPVSVSGLTDNSLVIDTGSSHTCAQTASGEVKCWGWNEYGQVGSGIQQNHSIPVDVVGLDGVILGISLGDTHTCAIQDNGRIKCWGRNAEGQLGDGTTLDRAAPTAIPGLNSGSVTIAAGAYHTCALNHGGQALCWGSNLYGQLGDGTLTTRFMPWGVSGLNGSAYAIDGGFYHTCALTSAGGVKCWGYNSYGQLGDGTHTDRVAPVDVVGLNSGARAIAAGDYHSCAIAANGRVVCWGENSAGQLGNGTMINQNTPVDVIDLGGHVLALTAGGQHSCALTDTGAVKCWGRNDFGQLGDGTNTNRTAPVEVAGLTGGVRAVSAGHMHTCAVMTTGSVKCWGRNGNGQLGDGTKRDRNTPVDVSGLTSGAQDVASARDHTCALLETGGMKCWGDNRYGQLGNNSQTTRTTPVDVLGLNGRAQALSAGDGHTCAVTDDGAAWCWGNNGTGQLGVNPGWVPVTVVGFGSAPRFLPVILRH